MAKTDLTMQCEKAIYYASGANGLGIYGAFEVTFGKAYGNERVDYMTMDSEGIFRCYEIKVSKSDFKSKAAKTFAGHFNYFVMPAELWEELKDADAMRYYLIRGIGIYTVSGGQYRAELVRKPKKKSGVNFNVPVLMHCMIRSLSKYAKNEFAMVSEGE